MMVALILTATLMPLLLAACFVLGRCWQRYWCGNDAISEVSRQHIEIFQTGQLNEAAVESAKRRFRALLENGDERGVEASLRPGVQYFFQVRALAELGTDAAGKILERQLERRLSNNLLDQSWYWVDLAVNLRMLQRQESLPYLLGCAPVACESPLGHFFAIETICYLGFAGYLKQPDTPMGRSALHVAFRAIDGFRSGIQPHLVLESQVGELVEMVWDHRPTGPAPLHVRVLVESLRLLRREANFRFALRDEPAEQEAIDWQLARIAALEPEIRDFLKNQSEILLPVLPSMAGQELTDSLQALIDMRVNAARELLPLLPNVLEQRGLMIEVLRWSRDSRVGPWLRDYARANVAMEKRAKRRAVADMPRQSTVPAGFPYVEILLSLRGHPSVETEQFLVIAAQDWDPRIRMSAVSSLGWWEPIVGAAVRACLVQCKRDPCPEVRQTARAALARLGERSSLHWFRQTMFSDDARQVIEASLLIAREGLTLLWPDLDRLVDSDNSDIALHASEAIQCLAEEMEQARS